MSSRSTGGLVLAAIAVAVAVEAAAAASLPSAVGDAVAGAALLAGGAVAIGTRRGAQSGALMTACGVAWFAGTLEGTLVFVHRGLLVHLVLAYPRLWPGSRVTAAGIVAGYLCAVITPLARSAEVTLALVAVVVATAVWRQRGIAGVERRARAAALPAAAAIGAALVVGAAGRLAGGSLDSFALWSYDTAVALTAIGLGADLRWGRWTHAAVTELVADLGELERPGALRSRLARALGDPQLSLGYKAAGDDGYVDEAGRPLVLPTGDAARAVAYVHDDGRPVAVLVHDASLLDDRRLLDAATAAARLAAANERMQEEVRDGVEQLEASRRRLVEAAIEQRRVLEEELRTGAEQRLTDVALRLNRLAEVQPEGGQALGDLAATVERTREDLRRFARGIHPAVLTEHGLGPALDEAAAATTFSVTVDVPRERLPASVEATLYFLCTEALANVGKHATATRVQIAVHRRDGVLEATIADDGGGGGDPARGSGLRGLADRIQALGGRLEVDSPEGVGTRLHAAIPI